MMGRIRSPNGLRSHEFEEYRVRWGVAGEGFLCGIHADGRSVYAVRNTKMFTAINRIRVRKGEGAELEARFGESSGIESEPGFIRFRLLKQTWAMKPGEDEDVDEYVSMTDWESFDHFTAWTKSESFRKAHSRPRLDGIVSSIPAGYEVINERQ